VTGKQQAVRIEDSVDHAGSAPERTDASSLRKLQASRWIINPANGRSKTLPPPSPVSPNSKKIRKSQMTKKASESDSQNVTISE
jgi:hypothetical protein